MASADSNDGSLELLFRVSIPYVTSLNYANTHGGQKQQQTTHQNYAAFEQMMVINSPVYGFQKVDCAQASKGLERDIYDDVVY